VLKNFDSVYYSFLDTISNRISANLYQNQLTISGNNPYKSNYGLYFQVVTVGGNTNASAVSGTVVDAGKKREI
jgi:hypothetical protein